MKIGYWVVRTYAAGAVGEKTKFFIPGARPEKSTRRERQEIKKQEQNEHSTEKRLARLINANFGLGDVLLGLDYSKKGMEKLIARVKAEGGDWDNLDDGQKMDALYAAAERELVNALRRVSRACGIEGGLKYIAVTSDMDGDTGESVRVHHHLLVPRSVCELFVQKWSKLGTVNWQPLREQIDYTPVAAYLCRQVRRIPDARKYKPSKNLIRPQPKDRAVSSEAEIRVPRGGTLLHRNEFRPGMPQYIRYALPPDKRPGRTKRE